ncbi:MAG: MMPL family transporter [Solirubrobacterales bacterium]|nr:MMPL family transporter [Solirubrobacterales bacterium]
MRRAGGSGRLFGRVASSIAGRPWPVVVSAVLLSAVSIWAAAGMGTQNVTDAFFDRDSTAYEQTERADQAFGSDPVVILARGPLVETLSTHNLNKLATLETCLAGRIREGRGRLFKICRQITDLKPATVIAGPATFLGRAVAGITEVYERQLKRLASAPDTAEGRAERARILSLAAQIISRYGLNLTRPPTLEDPTFVRRVVFGDGGVRSGPKPKLNYLFPSSDAAQIVMRLRSDLSEKEQARAIELIEAAAADPSVELRGSDLVVSGSPVVFNGLNDELPVRVLILAGVAVILMSLALFFVFGSVWRLLPLGLALGGVALAAGILRLAGGEFSLASLGAAPILIGLTVDYAVQLQARLDETGRLPADQAAGEAARLGVPMIATACLATAAGFGVLALSSLPLVSQFGLLLGGGVLICFIFTFCAGFAMLALRGERRPAPGKGPIVSRARDLAKPLLATSITAPGRVLLLSVLLGAIGWAVSTQAEVRAEIGQLLPSRAPVVQDLLEVEEATGTSGEIDLIVRAPDVTDPAVVLWTDQVRDRILAESGYGGENPSCEGAELCPGPAIPDFVDPSGRGITAADIQLVLKALPVSERKAMIAGGLASESDPTEAKIAFALRSGSVDRQQEVIDRMNRIVAGSRGGQGPPPGVTAEVTGLPVVVATSANDLADSRYLLVAAGILVIGLVLLLVYRSPRRVLVPLVPIVVAGGWSALIVAALDLSLNPLSTVLAVLVTAIATEFSVIISGRYFQEREAGASLARALRLTYGRTGIAVATSGLTAIAGFAALGTSDVAMLRDFGLIAVVDLAVALAGVAIVLPAMLVWLERR